MGIRAFACMALGLLGGCPAEPGVSSGDAATDAATDATTDTGGDGPAGDPEVDAQVVDAHAFDGPDPLWDEARSKAIVMGFDGRLLIWGTFSTDAAPHLFGLETGAPSTVLRQSFAGGAAQATGDLDVDVWEVSGTWPTVDLSERSAFTGTALGGHVGGDLFAQWRWTVFDYAGTHLYAFSDGTLPDTAPAGPGAGQGWTTVAYSDQGGHPVVNVSLGAAGAVPLIADTGMGPTVITETTWAALQDGTLPEREGYLWVTHHGADVGTLVRIPELRVGELTVSGEWAVVVPDDHHRANLTGQTGPTAGVLGTAFFRHFLVGFSAVDRAFKFMRYTDTSHIDADAFVRLGADVAWRPAHGGLVVSAVYAGGDAEAKGLMVGDVLVSVDGDAVGGWTLAHWQAAARGPVGSTVEVVWRRPDGGGAVTEMSADIAVDDLLPQLP